MKTRIYITEEILNPGRQSHDYPPTGYDDWQRARGHINGALPLRTLEQARADAAAVKKSLTTQERESAR